MNKKSIDENVISNNNSDINVTKRQDDYNNDVNMDDLYEEEQKPIVDTVNITNLSDWFDEHHKEINNISNVTARIKHVEPRKNLIMTAPDKQNKERYVWVFRDSHKLPVIDMKPDMMRVFESNTFEIDYTLNKNTRIVTYNMKNKLLVFPALIVDGVTVPYDKLNVFFENYRVNIPDTNREEIKKNLELDTDFDYIMSRYKHIRRKKKEVSKNKDIIKELCNRKNKVYDIRHLLTIDIALMNIANLE